MTPNASSATEEMAEASKRIAQRILDIGQNRLELLVVEAQEERERLLHAILLALGAAGFGLLTGIAFTFGIVIAFWDRSPLVVLAILTPLFGAVTFFLVNRLLGLKRDWRSFAATLDQLRKDCKCLANDMD